MLIVLDPYGSTESTRVDGKLVSALVTWDSKITTVVSLLGGVGDLVRRKMKVDEIYDDFVSIADVSCMKMPEKQNTNVTTSASIRESSMT